MRPQILAALALLTLAGGALAQSPPIPAQARQPRPAGAAAETMLGTQPADLEATRKRFEANSAKTAEGDRRRDAKLNQSMRSICAGCGGTTAVKHARAPKPTGRVREDELASPAD